MRRLTVILVLLALGGWALAASPPAVVKKAPQLIKKLPAPANAPAVQQKGPAPKITCDQPEYDFGTAAQGEQIKHTFVVRNTGKGVLKILRARGG